MSGNIGANPSGFTGSHGEGIYHPPGEPACAGGSIVSGNATGAGTQA
ncbi:hypothetical protein WAI91_21715 [Acinetobacter baumannii]